MDDIVNLNEESENFFIFGVNNLQYDIINLTTIINRI